MNYVGLWKLNSVATIGEDDCLVYMTPEEYLASPMPYVDETDEDAVADEMRERKLLIGAKLKVCDDGKLYMLAPLPEGVSKEEVDAAVAAGEIKLMDGMITQAPTAWEDRNGEFWFNSGIEGEALGEPTDPWVKAGDENGYIDFMNYRFVKEN